MRTITLDVASTPGDLAGLPVGSRIYTSTGKIMDLDVIEPGRKDSGSTYWIEDGTLSPYPTPPARWFPAVILPAAVDHSLDD